MKRSEMINKIEILLESIGYVGPSDSGDKVVELIEKAGMLPPHNGNAQKFDFSTPENATITVIQGYKWESEE